METEEYVQTRAPLRRPVRPIPIPEPPPPRISRVKGFGFIVVAIFVDCLEALLTLLAVGAVVDTIISICVTLFFWTMFKLCGVTFMGKPKNLGKLGTASIVELIPILNVVPAWTIGVWSLVGKTMEEDKQSGIIVTIYQQILKKIGL